MPWVRWADQGRLPQWMLDAVNLGIAAADCAPPLPEIDPQEWAAAVTYWRTVMAANAPAKSVDDGERDAAAEHDAVRTGALIFPGHGDRVEIDSTSREVLHRLDQLVGDIHAHVVGDPVVDDLRHNKLLALHGLVTRYVGRGYLAVRDQLQRKAGTRQSGLSLPTVGQLTREIYAQEKRAQKLARFRRGMR